MRLGRTSNALNGSLDEVRISNSGRGDGWIQTEYNNQSSPATFYTVGPELTGAVCITNYRSIGTAADETAGTATATNGSKVVTGSDTAWRTNNRGIGDQIDLGGADYTILSVDSDTKLTLTEPFSGAYSGAYTIARQFTTIPQWENCISLAGCPGGYPFPPATASLVADNRTERGIAYNDSVFSVGATINGSTTDATHNITLTVAPGNRHNGTAGSGVALDGGGTIQTLLNRDDYTRLEWFEFRNCKGADGNVVSAGAQNVLVSHLIVHDFDDPVFTNIDGISIQSSAGVFSLAVRNSIVYDGEDSCVQADGADDTLTVENSTLYGCRRGVYEDAGSTINVRNTIAMANSTADFAVSVGTQSNNLSQDATAPGVGSLTLRAPANQFVSLTSGAEDFHLVTSADALDAGTPLSDVVVDIDLQTRPSGVQWDMGADERPGAGALGCPVVQQAWFDADWSFRKAIVIDSAQVAASLTGFPVLIHLATDPELAGAAQVNGDDIVFTASDGVTKLSHEIELFVKATGELVVWVNVPYLSGGADTTIYMYYGSAVPGSQEDVAGVWDASYGGVWHLDENPDDPAPQFEDVTSNTNDGTANSLSVVNQVPGQIEGSLEFDDTLERHVNVPDDPSLRLATNMTVSSWIRTIYGDRSAAVIVNKWQAGGNKNYGLGKLDAASLLFQVHNDTYLATAPLGPVLDGSWHHVVGVADASTGELRIYVDGTEQGNDPTYSGTSETGTSPLQIGKSTDVITQTWEGRIDEVRVSGTVRSAEWILTEHTNQNNPPGFYTVCSAATAVRLSSFTATGADGAVELVWETASELNNLSFHLYRSTSESGSYARITTSVVPGLGSSPAGARYSYRDTGLTNGVTYYYELEDIETTGVTERHGPVSAMPQAGSTTGEGETSERALITYGEPTSTSLHVVKRTRTGMVLELRTGGFYAEPAEDGSVHLKIPDFEELSEAGAPAMPVKRSWVEALAGRKVTLVAVTAHDVEAFTALRPTNAPLVELVASETGAVRTARRERRRQRRAFRGEGLYPSEAARLVTVGFQGETKKALVELAPLRWDESTGELSLTRRLVVRLSFQGREASEQTTDGVSGRRYRGEAGARNRRVVARLSTREPGVYGVRFEEVLSRSRAVLTSVLRVSRLGETVALHVEPEPSRLGPGSTLYFVSEGEAANPYGRQAAYELEVGLAGEVMEHVDGSPSGESVREYWQRVRHEEDRYYQAGLLQAPDLWLWDVLVSPVRKSYGFEVSALAPSSIPSHLAVWLQGTSDFAPSPDHHVRVYVNGTLVSESSWDGKKARKLEAELLPGVLREGANVLELENVGDTEARYSLVMLDRYEVDYPRFSLAEGNELHGTWRQTGSAEVPAVSPGIVLDVTGPSPRWLEGVESLEDGTLRFRADAGQSYRVVGLEAVKRAEIRRPKQTRLKSTRNRADYVVIGPQAFLEAAAPLIQLRRSQGLLVEAVSTEAIYEAFGYGERRPAAIREFLAYAYHRWRRPSLRYVLLLGDASYDFKDLLGTGVKNHVPPLMGGCPAGC